MSSFFNPYGITTLKTFVTPDVNYTRHEMNLYKDGVVYLLFTYILSSSLKVNDLF